MIPVTEQEAANYIEFVKETQYKHLGRTGFRVSEERQKEAMKKWYEYPSIRYVSKSLSMAPKTVKKILSMNGVVW